MPMRGVAALFGIALPEIVVVLAILAAVAFAFWMFVEAVANEAEPRVRVCWALALGLAPYVAAPLYFTMRYLPGRRRARAPAGRDSSSGVRV